MEQLLLVDWMFVFRENAKHNLLRTQLYAADLVEYVMLKNAVMECHWYVQKMSFEIRQSYVVP